MMYDVCGVWCMVCGVWCMVYGFMVWYALVYYSMVWYGMVCFGMVWYGMVWCSIVYSMSKSNSKSKSNSTGYQVIMIFYCIEVPLKVSSSWVVAPISNTNCVHGVAPHFLGCTHHERHKKMEPVTRPRDPKTHP